jgi:hypothetical protein
MDLPLGLEQRENEQEDAHNEGDNQWQNKHPADHGRA